MICIYFIGTNGQEDKAFFANRLDAERWKRGHRSLKILRTVTVTG